MVITKMTSRRLVFFKVLDNHDCGVSSPDLTNDNTQKGDEGDGDGHDN